MAKLSDCEWDALSVRHNEAEAKFSRNKRGKSAKFQRSVLKLKSAAIALEYAIQGKAVAF